MNHNKNKKIYKRDKEELLKRIADNLVDYYIMQRHKETKSEKDIHAFVEELYAIEDGQISLPASVCKQIAAVILLSGHPEKRLRHFSEVTELSRSTESCIKRYLHTQL